MKSGYMSLSLKKFVMKIKKQSILKNKNIYTQTVNELNGGSLPLVHSKTQLKELLKNENQLNTGLDFYLLLTSNFISGN